MEFLTACETGMLTSSRLIDEEFIVQEFLLHTCYSMRSEEADWASTSGGFAAARATQSRGRALTKKGGSVPCQRHANLLRHFSS